VSARSFSVFVDKSIFFHFALPLLQKSSSDRKLTQKKLRKRFFPCFHFFFQKVSLHVNVRRLGPAVIALPTLEDEVVLSTEVFPEKKRTSVGFCFLFFFSSISSLK